MKTHTFTRDIEFHEDILHVEFTAEMISQNDGIGSYEFWGSREFDKGEDYWSIDKLSWDYDSYTKEQNAAISAYIDENWAEIDEKEGDEYQVDYEPDYDDYDDDRDYDDEADYVA